MDLVFFGTPKFALPCLRVLIGNADLQDADSSGIVNYNIKAVVTQKDKTRGRSSKLIPSDIKAFALEKNLTVLEPENIRQESFIETIKRLNPHAIVVVAYGKIIPKEILEVPKFGTINIHPSLLPKYRGAAPIQRAIVSGDNKTGVCTMLMDEGMDTGPVLKVEEVEINPDDTYDTLSNKLSEIGAQLLLTTLELIKKEKIKPTPQVSSKATYAPPIKKEEGLIDWNMSAVEISNRVRGFNPWPCAYTYINNKRVKILKVEPMKLEQLSEKADRNLGPESILKKDTDGFIIKTGDGLISIKELQPEGKKVMNYKAFLQGRLNKDGGLVYVGKNS